mmetsp:Transcript_36279/g.58630  ORF Transcript_36279/g.58630 Transcript_36279/m.58630 type:complete len:278 (+) Transcript_36279:29-862(+)
MVAAKRRLVRVEVWVAVGMLLMGLLFFFSDGPFLCSNTSVSPNSLDTTFQFPDFAEIAKSENTDKFEHGYSPAYQQYVPMVVSKLKGRPLKFLEIGLGCWMPYGEGHSAPVWRRFLPPTTEVTILEFVEDCALSWHARTDFKDYKLVIGSQDNATLLQRMTAEHGPFDIIIDDGSHKASHQRASFLHLFPPMSPGGVYFMEDVQTSYAPEYEGGTLGNQTDTALTLASQIMNNMFYGRPEFKLGAEPPPRDDPIVVGTYQHIRNMDIHDTMVVYVHK